MELLTHPFSLGLLLGLVFTLLALVRLFTTKAELRRFQHHLSERVRIEADHVHREKGEGDKMRAELENLRLKIGQLQQTPDRLAERNLEILIRAEKRMTTSAPGFAAAWENAKTESLRELESEEAGRSLPRRMFSRLLGKTPSTAALPSETGEA